jgi:CDP-ribitol ribitolphosphotransferase
VLYAPTFSPSLTSASFLIDEFKELAESGEYLILVKFHDLMAAEWIEAYKELSMNFENIVYEEERNIIKFLLIADCMVSDTSSVVYEFLLLDKPVITFKSSSKSIRWENATNYKNLRSLVDSNLKEDEFKLEREKINAKYHPYNDGNSALRMVETTGRFIAENGVPESRKLSFMRRRKIHKIFGKY